MNFLDLSFAHNLLYFYTKYHKDAQKVCNKIHKKHLELSFIKCYYIINSKILESYRCQTSKQTGIQFPNIFLT